MNEGEVLVVGYLPGQGSGWPVAAQYPPDVAVLRASIADLPAIAQQAQLVIIRQPDGATERVGDERVLDELDEGARLFVSAWLRRSRPKTDRRGEGLAWDAPGFDAPG